MLFVLFLFFSCYLCFFSCFYAIYAFSLVFMLFLRVFLFAFQSQLPLSVFFFRFVLFYGKILKYPRDNISFSIISFLPPSLPPPTLIWLICCFRSSHILIFLFSMPLYIPLLCTTSLYSSPLLSSLLCPSLDSIKIGASAFLDSQDGFIGFHSWDNDARNGQLMVISWISGNS